MTMPEATRIRMLRIAAVGILVVSVLMAALVPIYTDEIGWRMHMRAAIDGVDITFADICGPNTLVHPPWFMMPARWFSANANLVLADPVFVRAAGVACAVLWVGLLFALIARLVPDADRRQRMQVVLLSLLGMGLLPFLMVLSRPEQPLLLALTAMVIIALAPAPSRDGAGWAWAKVALILGLSVIALSYHLKGVLYSVVAMACLIACARGRATVLPRLVGGAAMLALTASAALYWIGRFRCPGDALLAAKFGRENLAAVISQGGSGADLVLQGVRGANPFSYVWLAIPTTRPMSGWMPPEIYPGSVTATVGVLLLAAWAVAFALTVLALARHFASSGWRGLVEPRLLIALAIFGCVLVWGASQLNKNAYEASHVLPILLVAFALTWSLPKARPHGHSSARAALPLAFVAAAVLSQVLVLGASAGPLLQAAQDPGHLERQPVSLSVADYDTVRRDIRRAMAASGIPMDRQLRRLLIDDVTYLALQEHELPLHHLGVLSTWNGSITDPVAYLRSRNSDGVVVGCRYLPPEMRAAASSSGEICAISRSGLESIERGRSAGESGGGADAA